MELNPENLGLFLIFCVPGIIILYARSLFLSGKVPSLSEGILIYATVSVLYHAIIFPIASPLYQGDGMAAYKWQWILLLFIFPSVIGALLGINIKNNWTRRILAGCGLQTVHPVDNAWDWYFANCQKCWVLATLKDGTRWAGFLGVNSFMSSSREERDIFIQIVYEIGENSVWTARRSSVWIAPGELQSLEFWTIE